MRRPFLALGLLPLLALVVPAKSTTPSLPFTTVKLADASGGTEPRVTVAPDGSAYTITNSSNTGNAVVYASHDHGLTWQQTEGTLVGQSSATIDTDIVATASGRLIGSELDTAGPSGAINFQNSYSDDNGSSWHASTGATFSDTDRQWFAVDAKRDRVYILWHNLASGFANHNMWVQTSTDGGKMFGAPVPTTLPGDQAYADLQCADSGGPSGIAVNQATGQVYVFFGTRASSVAPTGGCGASVSPGPFEVNVVSATRVWVATSPDGSATSWTQSLAVDRAATGQVVGMELSPGAVDTAGNVYVVFPESKDAADFTAAIKYVSAGPDLKTWSEPRTVAALAGAGNILPHVVAGDPGRLTFAYYRGVDGKGPSWYSMAAQTLDGLSAQPHFVTTQLSPVVTYTGTAGELMAQCGSGPAQGIENGFACGRSADVYGITLDQRGYAYVAWPATGKGSGTYVSAQTGGASLYAAQGAKTTKPPVTKPPVTKPVTTPKATPPLATTGLASGITVVAVLLILAALVVGRRMRHGRPDDVE